MTEVEPSRLEAAETLLLALVRESEGDSEVLELGREHLNALGHGAEPPLRRQGSGRGITDLAAWRERRELYAAEEAREDE